MRSVILCNKRIYVCTRSLLHKPINAYYLYDIDIAIFGQHRIDISSKLKF